MTRALWPVGCIDCGFDASFQPSEIIACPSCGGRLVAAAPETLEHLHDPTDEMRQLAHRLEAEGRDLREAVEALVDVMPYCHPNPNSPHAAKWEEWRQAALDKAALALGERDASPHSRETTLADVEFMLMVDYIGIGGTFGSEARFRRSVSEDDVLDEARRLIGEHAGRVEIFRREIKVPWEKVEELRRSHVMHE